MHTPLVTGRGFARNEVSLIGQSEAIRALRSDIECAASCDAKVLITGETGVGKEVISRLIHLRSPRASTPLVAINCAGLPDTLLESELFGHRRGSFTDAHRDKPGIFETVSGGTVLLDEVGEMSPRMQVVLLRFLETNEIQRIGDERPATAVNVRLITATNRELHTHIASGAFREDLYFRLNVIRLSIPPLRERVEDIPLLVDHYVGECSRQHGLSRPEVTQAALDALCAYRWPGNVREMKNVVERLVLKADGGVIRPSDLPLTAFRARTAKAVAVSVGEVTPEGIAASLANRIFEGGESFWSLVYPLFMARDLTRDELREIVRLGLERTSGNYRLLAAVFGMAESDYKRFLSFLRKHGCYLPFRQFRVARRPEPRASSSSIAS